MSNFNEEFLNFFKKFIIKQEIRDNHVQPTIVEILGMLKNPSRDESLYYSTENLVGAPAGRKTTDPEFLIEALSTSLTEFIYDPENDCTFENWYRRFKDFFERDAANLDDAAKVRLLLRKLETAAHKRYINFILPKVSSDFNFSETIEKLSKIFGKHESLFKTRYKCFKMCKNDETNYLDYMGNVNKACEDFELNKMTIDQFKCLIFAAGLSSTKDADIRTKLLSKLETEHDKITLEKLCDEYGRLINLQKDASMIQKPIGSDLSILVNQVSKNKRHFSKKNKPKPQASNDNCKNCGRIHQDNQCPAAKSKCSFCSLNGHWVQFCRKKLNDEINNCSDASKDNSKSTPTGRAQSKSKVSSIRINVIKTHSKRKYVKVIINGRSLTLQVDSGADVSVISEKVCKKMNFKIRPTTLAPDNASGDPLDLIGEIECTIDFLNKTKYSTIFVSQNEDLNVFGNDLPELFDLWNKPFSEFCLNERVFHIKKHDDYVEILESKYPSCFEKSLGRCKNFKAHLTLKGNSYPPFIKYRPPPFAYQSLIEEELK